MQKTEPESLVPLESCFTSEYDFRQCRTVKVQQFIQLENIFDLSEDKKTDSETLDVQKSCVN
jgi:hypothetical protein